MFLDLRSKIDKKISLFFEKEQIKSIDKNSLDYFGINISSEINKDFEFKIYFNHKKSWEIYTQHEKNPLIDFLFENNFANFLTIVHDKNHKNSSRYDVGLANRETKNMQKIFEFLEKNCSFFNKFKDEIKNLSLMKTIELDDYAFDSFYFLALIKNGNDEILKCHWLNKVYSFKTEYNNNEYYLDFIEKSNIEGLKKLLPATKTILKNCNASMWMQGIDYNQNQSQKHKIYINKFDDCYEGLIKTFKDNSKLKKEIKNIRSWNKLHKEFICKGFAYGIDKNNNSTLNFYFRFKK